MLENKNMPTLKKRAKKKRKQLYPTHPIEQEKDPETWKALFAAVCRRRRNRIIDDRQNRKKRLNNNNNNQTCVRFHIFFLSKKNDRILVMIKCTECYL